MAATLAILLALIATSSASPACKGSGCCPNGPSKVAFEWANITYVDGSVYNSNLTKMSVDAQKLSWVADIEQVLDNLTVDLDVCVEDETGKWKQVEKTKNANFCSNTPDDVLAYAELLGVRDSTPPILSTDSDSATCPVQKQKFSLANFSPAPSRISSSFSTGRHRVFFNFEVNGTSISSFGFIANISC